MVPIDEVGKAGEPIPVVDFPGGQPVGDLGDATRAPAIVRAPGANAVLVANPKDEVIYYYKEGMAAPMGGFSNYGRQPVAVEVVDRSLREVEPGVYETLGRLAAPGDYDVAVFVDTPRVTHCFQLQVEPDPR